MLNFFHLPTSCSTAVKAALEITGEPHQLITVDLANPSDAFKAASPLGKVPVITGSDNTIFEGGAINLWLNARNPDAHLMPPLGTTEGGEALKWLFFVYATVHPVWVRMFFPQRFADEIAKASVQDLAKAELIRHYGLIDAQLADRDFVAGDAISLADLYLASTLHWEGAIGNVLTTQYPALKALKSRVLNDSRAAPAFADGYSVESS